MTIAYEYRLDIDLFDTDGNLIRTLDTTDPVSIDRGRIDAGGRRVGVMRIRSKQVPSVSGSIR